MQQLSKIYLAPMLGITDCTFRTAFAETYRGVQASIAPFVRLTADGDFPKAKLRDLLPKANKKLAVVPQLMSNSAIAIVKVSRLLRDEMGYDEINWNLGCPAPTTADRGMGCGLMPDPERIDGILGKVFSEATPRLSIKTRLGYADPDEIHQLILILNRYPLERVIIHPRTGVQGYQGQVDLEKFTRAMQSCVHPLGYSGDIKSLECWNRISKSIPIPDSYYLGRGLLGDPELAEKLQNPETESDAVDWKRYRRFLSYLAEGYLSRDWGEKQTVSRLKTIWYYFADQQSLTANHRKKVRRTKDLELFLELASSPEI